MGIDGYLLLQLVEDELNNDVVLEAEDLRDALRDPRLDDLQVHLCHVHLRLDLSKRPLKITKEEETTSAERLAKVFNPPPTWN